MRHDTAHIGPADPLDDANGDGYPDWLVLGLKPTAVNDGSPPSIYDLLLADGYGFDSNGVLRLCNRGAGNGGEMLANCREFTVAAGPVPVPLPTLATLPPESEWYIVDRIPGKHNELFDTCVYERSRAVKTITTIICMGPPSCTTALVPVPVTSYVGLYQREKCEHNKGDICPPVPGRAHELEDDGVNPACNTAAFYQLPFAPSGTGLIGYIPLVNPCNFPLK